MIAWALLDPTGRVPVSLGRSASMPEGAVALPEELTADVAARMQVAGGQWTDRPVVSAPLVERIDDAVVVSWTGLPSGSLARVIDGQTGDALASLAEGGGLLSVTLVDPGLFLIDLEAPLPWIGWSGEVTA